MGGKEREAERKKAASSHSRWSPAWLLCPGRQDTGHTGGLAGLTAPEAKAPDGGRRL